MMRLDTRLAALEARAGARKQVAQARRPAALVVELPTAKPDAEQHAAVRVAVAAWVARPWRERRQLAPFGLRLFEVGVATASGRHTADLDEAPDALEPSGRP